MLNKNNLFILEGSHQLTPFIGLHISYESLHCDLYRIALSGFLESAPPEYLRDAPPDWIARMRLACFVRAQAISHIFNLTQDTFPDFTCHSLYITISVYESIRNQLRYLELCPRSDELNSKALAMGRDFDVMMNVISRTTKYFRSNLPAVSFGAEGVCADGRSETSAGCWHVMATRPIGRNMIRLLRPEPSRQLKGWFSPGCTFSPDTERTDKISRPHLDVTSRQSSLIRFRTNPSFGSQQREKSLLQSSQGPVPPHHSL